MVSIGRVWRKCSSAFRILPSILIGYLLVEISHRFLAENGHVLGGYRLLSSKDKDKSTIIDWNQLNFSELHVRQNSCTFWRCFNPYRCNFYGDNRLTVHIYLVQNYLRSGSLESLVPTPSKEYSDLVNAIRRSPHFEPEPNRACLLIPSIDLLNQNRFQADSISVVLNSSTWWNGGENHLLFNMLPSSWPNYSHCLDGYTGKAVVAGGGFGLDTYRPTFDVSIPVYNPLTQGKTPRLDRKRNWLLVSSKPFPKFEEARILRQLQGLHSGKVSFLRECSSKHFNASRRCSDGNMKERWFRYPEILETARYCLILEGNRLGQAELSDALQFGCVPVLFADEYVPPFHDVLDWKRAAVSIYRHQLSDIVEILESIDENRHFPMVAQGQWFWKAYFSSMEQIAMTTLRVLQDRVFPHQIRTYSEWNDNKQAIFPFRPLENIRMSTNDGFTAVILTFDRLTSLFLQIRQLSRVQSLAKIVVVWNNQNKDPPPVTDWPKIGKPVKVIRTSSNRLTNRFVPYSEIETEAVLSLDDDIAMLSADELEFGYQAWREFPSYLVGFPSRVHLYDVTGKRFVYHSEWMNNVSLVLTGAAFYHNYYNLLFTEAMPVGIKNWIDRIMNCEDIAMNFLIANYTGQPALKVTPRKKFKNVDQIGQDLSADSAHLKQRTECLNRLTKVFGGMKLKTAEFRLDPLLYKINSVPDDVKMFPDIGAL